MALALAAAGQFAEIANLEIARTVFGLSELITESSENIRVNGDQVRTVARRIHDFVTAIAPALSSREADEPDEWHRALEGFLHALEGVQDLLRERAQRSFFSQALSGSRDSAALVQAYDRVRDAFRLLTVHARLVLVELSSALRQQLADYAQLEDVPLLRDARSQSREDTPPYAVPTIPPAPLIYFGRATATRALVDAVTSGSSGRVVVLGGPGVGKTSLSLAVLHAPAVAHRFSSRRYFVACDSVAAGAKHDCLRVIASTFGVASLDRTVMQSALTALLRSGPLLLVLDNFESLWEAADHRVDAEAALRFLADIDGLSLIVTLRGSERPQGVAWTRPFFPVLGPLDDVAAKQTFLAISDTSDVDPDLPVLLRHLDNLPLAVVLLGNLAQCEPLNALLASWRELGPATLTRGGFEHRLSSLNASIMLSLRSARMMQEPTAMDLLSLLALLPGGIMDVDLRFLGLPIDAVQRALSTLLQAALATRDSTNRINLLAPIREFMLSQYPPSRELALPVCRHYCQMLSLSLVNSFGATGARPIPLATIRAEIENIEFTVRYALRNALDYTSSVTAVLCMHFLSNTTGVGSSDAELLSEAISAARAHGVHDIAADILVHWGISCYNGIVRGDAQMLWREAEAFYLAVGNVAGVIDTASRLSRFLPSRDAIPECIRIHAMAVSHGDVNRIAACSERLAEAYTRAGRMDDARDCHRATYAVLSPNASKRGEYRLMAASLIRMAQADMMTGDLSAGLIHLDEAEPTLEHAEWPLGVEWARWARGEILCASGLASDALEPLQRAAGGVHVLGARGIVEIMRLLTLAHLALCDEPAAARAVATAQELLDNVANPTFEDVVVLHARGELALWREALDEARAIFRSALSTCRGRDFNVVDHVVQVQAAVMVGLGQVEAADARFALASSNYVVAVLLYRLIGCKLGVVCTLAKWASVLEDDTAEAVLNATVPILRHFTCRRELADGLLAMATIAQRRGHLDVARSHARTAVQHFEETKDQRGRGRANAFLTALGTRSSSPAL